MKEKGGLGGKLNWVTIIGDIKDGGHMGIPDYMLLVGVHQGLCWWWMWYSTKTGCGTPPRVVAVVVGGMLTMIGAGGARSVGRKCQSVLPPGQDRSTAPSSSI